MRKRLFIFGTCGVLTLGVCSILLSFFQRDIQGQEGQSESIAKLSNVVNNVAEITIVQTALRNANKPSGDVWFVIRNDSDKPITHITVVSGDDNEASGITFGMKEGILVPAHGVFEMSFPFSKVIAGFPIRVGGVMYLDESVSGDRYSRDALKSQKEKDRKDTTWKSEVEQKQ
jgi:hypothetical protein